MIDSGSVGRASDCGPARHGAGDWLAQRLTGLALVPLCIWFITSALLLRAFDQPSLAAWMRTPWNALALIALVLVCAVHSYLGLRVIVEDYVHSPSWRIAALALLQFAHWVLAAIAVFAVPHVALGGGAA